MTKTAAAPQMSRIGDEALKAKTGKTWAEWFAVLDKAGAAKMNHTEIADYLYKDQGCPGWYNQMVAVGYEQVHGLRQKHEKPEGYEISVSRTIGASAPVLFRAWNDARSRRAWLAEDITIRKATPSKSMRVTWSDGKTSLDVHLYPKGNGKCQVVVQHAKLPNAKAAEKMKAYWSKALDRLQEKM